MSMAVSEFTLVAAWTHESRTGAGGRETPPLCGVCELSILEPPEAFTQT